MDYHTTFLHPYLANTVQKGRIFTLFHGGFPEKLLSFYNFLKELNGQIAGNDCYELKIMFEVLIVLFLFVDISIIAFEKSYY